MHEQVLAKRIIEKANEQGQVTAIEVEVGELAEIPTDELQAALILMTGWDVAAKETPSIIACECGFEGRAKVLEKYHDRTIFACPECKANMPSIIKGDEIVLVSCEVK